MALTTLSPLVANLTQPLTTNVITTNFTTLPFLTLGNATTDLPFLIPDPSLFSTDPPSFLLGDLNSNNTFTEYDYAYDNNGTAIASSSSSNDTTDTEEEINPFLAQDYNFYDYNPYDPNASLIYEPYDYSQLTSDPEENKEAFDEVMEKWDGVNFPPPIRPIAYNALTDLNPWFLWTPPIICLLSLFIIVLPCILLKLRDDLREKQGKSRKYGSFRKKSMIRKHFEDKERVEDLERQAVAASSSLPMQPGDAYSDIQYVACVAPNANGVKKSQVKNGKVTPGLVTENVLYIEENDLSMKKENGNVVSKRLAVDEPPVDYKVEEEILATREPPSKQEGDENIELQRYSSSSGSFTPVEEAAASGETSLGSSSGPERRAEGDEGSEEEDEEVRAHRSGNFSTAPKTYTKFTGWNRDLYSNGAGFGPPARKNSSKEEGGSPPEESADKDWGMY